MRSEVLLALLLDRVDRVGEYRDRDRGYIGGVKPVSSGGLGGIVADQPLKADDIPPDLRGAFRHKLLQHLSERGAHTLKELEQDPPWMVGLPLDQAELAAAIDFSRRRGEIEPIGETGWGMKTGEWGLTDFGRANASPLISRALRWITTSAFAVAGAFVGFGDTLGISVSLKGLGWERWVTIAVVGLLVAEFVFLALLDYRYGLSRSKIAKKWNRYRRVRERGYIFYSKRRLMLAISLAAIVVLMVLIFLPQSDVVRVVAIVVFIGVVVAHGLLARYYVRARGEWRSANRKWRREGTPESGQAEI